MKIINLLYLKYFLSLFICLISSFIIFFIFSLIGNLDEEYLFNIILSLSFLNSLQILIYVPSFIFFLSVILLIIFLRSKNEIIIIKSYINIKKLMVFFIPVIVFFSLLEVNKNKISMVIENGKSNLTKGDKKLKTKIIVENLEDRKIFSVIKNFNLNDDKEIEFRSYEIVNKEILFALFSDDLILTNETLIAKNYTEYNDNLIKEIKKNELLNIKLNDLNLLKSVTINNTAKDRLNIDTRFINLIIFFILFYNYIFLYFFSKTFVSTKQSIKVPVFTCLIILIYSFFIFNNSLSLYKVEFELLSSAIVGIFFLKAILYE